MDNSEDYMRWREGEEKKKPEEEEKKRKEEENEKKRREEEKQEEKRGKKFKKKARWQSRSSSPAPKSKVAQVKSPKSTSGSSDMNLKGRQDTDFGSISDSSDLEGFVNPKKMPRMPSKEAGKPKVKAAR